jgi:hypothetical protein
MKKRGSALPLALLVTVVGAAVPAHATEYWSAEGLLRDFFRRPADPQPAVGFKPFTLSAADAAAIGKQLGAPVKTSWNVYVAEDESKKRLGYALLDKEIGLHEYIDYGVLFDVAGVVQRLEIRAYREPYGDQVRDSRFRQRFVGKTANDAFVAGKDIDIISGVTYSSRAMALGVKRDALVLQAALKNGGV